MLKGEKSMLMISLLSFANPLDAAVESYQMEPSSMHHGNLSWAHHRAIALILFGHYLREVSLGLVYMIDTTEKRSTARRGPA
jgi:hypothetical protein